MRGEDAFFEEMLMEVAEFFEARHADIFEVKIADFFLNFLSVGFIEVVEGLSFYVDGFNEDAVEIKNDGMVGRGDIHLLDK